MSKINIKIDIDPETERGRALSIVLHEMDRTDWRKAVPSTMDYLTDIARHIGAEPYAAELRTLVATVAETPADGDPTVMSAGEPEIPFRWDREAYDAIDELNAIIRRARELMASLPPRPVR